MAHLNAVAALIFAAGAATADEVQVAVASNLTAPMLSDTNLAAILLTLKLASIVTVILLVVGTPIA